MRSRIIVFDCAAFRNRELRHAGRAYLKLGSSSSSRYTRFREDGRVTYLFIVNDSPYGSQRTYNTLTF